MRSWLERMLGGLCAAGALLAIGVGVSQADVVSDEPAAIIVVPKIVVHTELEVDTLIQLTNESNTEVKLQCFYVNATPVCGNDSGNCIPGQRFADLTPCTPSTQCIQQWQETDFQVILTKNQPVAWLASVGAVDCRRLGPTGFDLDLNNNPPCFPLDGTFRIGEGGQSNAGSIVPPVGQDPFIGELKCIAVDDNDQPVFRNDVYGHVTIVGRPPAPDLPNLSGYNAIGVQAVGICEGSDPPIVCHFDAECPDSPCIAQNNADKVLVLGRPGDDGVEYNGCANILILDHFFDFAEDPITGVPVITDLTLVPCSQDFLRQETFRTTVQFLVFNEFEQRFSTSRPVECYRDIQLSNIDTSTADRSIFSAQVAGTLTGQTRIRGVVGSDPAYGNTLMGIAEEFRGDGTAAFNLHTQGVRPQRDYIYLP